MSISSVLLLYLCSPENKIQERLPITRFLHVDQRLGFDDQDACRRLDCGQKFPTADNRGLHVGSFQVPSSCNHAVPRRTLERYVDMSKLTRERIC